jgi:hypothetical protein
MLIVGRDVITKTKLVESSLFTHDVETALNNEGYKEDVLYINGILEISKNDFKTILANKTQEDIIGYINEINNIKNNYAEKYSELLNNKKAQNKKQKSDVLTVPCSRPFVVSQEKAEDFMKHSNSKENQPADYDIKELVEANRQYLEYAKEQIQKILDEFEKLAQKDPEKARRIAREAIIQGLIESGIINENGEIKAPYNQENINNEELKLLVKKLTRKDN